tara:strand:- start:1300 stop:1530 length:231 start_codon:yes stop_codon:yes gene_type:complete
MENKHIKIFSEAPIIVNRLRSLLEEEDIISLVKNNIESARLAGFGALSDIIDVYILSTDIEKASEIVNTFKKEINS